MLSLIKRFRGICNRAYERKNISIILDFFQLCITDLVSLRTHNRGKLSSSYKSDSFALLICFSLRKAE